MIQLKTGDGANLATAGVTVTVAVQGGGALAGAASAVTDAAGRAAFSGLAITSDPGTRALVFSAPGFGDLTSNAITVTAAPPSGSLSSIVPSPGTVVAGTPSTITVTVRDAGGNPLRGRTVVLQPSGVDDAITPASQPTGGDGTATFSFSSASPGLKTIAATADGVAIGNTQVTVEPVPTTTTILGTSPSGAAKVGTPVTVTFAVSAVSGAPSGIVTVTSSLGSSACSDAVASGRCTLASLPRGTQTLTAAYPATGRFAGSSGTAAYEVTNGRR